ncbi:MAG: hypothetical protein HFJ35_02150 [Clostridia bacterium]|nr:hypothetical protein [Clostridia bacterium]
MKTQKFDFENKQIIQIYISKQEQENSKIIEEINQLKKQYSNISIFINGENDTIKAIKEMLNYKKSKNIK